VRTEYKGNITQEELGDAGDDTPQSQVPVCGCPDDIFQNIMNGDCNSIMKLLQEIKAASSESKQLTLQKVSLLEGRFSIDTACISKLYFDMSWIHGKETTFDPSKYQITKSSANSAFGSNAQFWAIKYENVLEIKIPDSDADAEKKIKALEKWLFDEKSDDEGVILDKEGNWWVSQFNESLFGSETCWSQQCCNKAARQILTTAGTTVGDRIIISQTNRACEDSKGAIIKYDDSGLAFNQKEFEEAVQVIDISLKEHKLPVMVGVQHPYLENNTRHYQCGSTSNTPRATNHFIVIVGKGYDKSKKMDFYYFYEVGTSNKFDAISRVNKLWVDTNQHAIKGNVSNKAEDNYYIVTDVRKNSGKIYNIKKK
jgi:hypothetical protein